MIKEECGKGAGPKKVLSDVSASVGGVLLAADSCELPRSEQQISKLKSRMKVCNSSDDKFAVVLQQAFMEDNSSQFIREVKCLREPAIVAATERQLNDLVRFCTVPGKFGVLTIDPTFCLGDFDVTVVTYRHLLLLSRKTNQPPALIGPVLVHYKNTFATYLYFASSLVGLRKELHNIKCFGTDGEVALRDAFHNACPNSLHLTCSIHVKKNVKMKVQDLGVSEHSRSLILADIFGKQNGSHYEEGLVDVANEQLYDKMFTLMIKKWKQYNLTEKALDSFVQWFQGVKSDVIKRSMLSSVREKAGLGTPPPSFTTNASESVNALLKKKVDYKRSELPIFLSSLKELIQEQDDEISRALIGRGKYFVNPKFKKLEKTETEWFSKMREADRTHHLQRFSSFRLSPSPGSKDQALSDDSYEPSSQEDSYLTSICKPNSQLPCQSEPSCSYSQDEEIFYDSQSDAYSCYTTPGLNQSEDEDVYSPPKIVRRRLFQSSEPSVPISDFLDEVSVPEVVLQGIWSKASELLSMPNAICKAPGLMEKSHHVLSYSGNRPHLVSCKKTGQYTCDKACANCNSLGICSHTVAVAEINSDLSEFVSWLKKAKKKPSLTKLVLTGMPDGKGEKGGKRKRKRSTPNRIESRTSLEEVLTKNTQSNRNYDNPLVLSSTSLPGPSFFISTFTSSPSSQSVLSQSLSTYKIPSYPPPLVRYTPQSPPAKPEPFTLCFISGNISVCYGCRQKYQKPCHPPDDLCVRHKEWRDFFPPGSSTAQTKFCNVYYHCNIPCIQARCPFFTSDQLVIPATVAAQMLPVHTRYIAESMPR